MNFSLLSDANPKPWCNINCHSLKSDLVNAQTIDTFDGSSFSGGFLTLHETLINPIPDNQDVVVSAPVAQDGRLLVSSQTLGAQTVAFLSDIPIIPAPFQDNNIVSNDSLTEAKCADGDIFTVTNSTGTKINITPSTYDLDNINSFIHLSPTPDGSTQANSTYMGATNGITMGAVAVTQDAVLLVKDSLPRLIVDNEISLKNASNTQCLRVYDYGTQVFGAGQPLATGVRCSINLDGDIFFNREDPVFGLKEIFLCQGTNTRVWSPSTASEVNIDESYIKLKRNNVEKLLIDNTGVKVSQSYYLPATVGTNGQMMTSNGAGTSSWQTPTPAYGIYSATAPVTVANTVVQLSIIGAGVGSLTIPAGVFTAGMAYGYKCGGTFGALNNALIRFRLTNSGILFDSGNLQFSPAIASGRPWNIDVTFVYTGGTTMITNFNFQYNNGSDARGFTAQQQNNTFNPLISNTLDFTVQWGSASASNTITANYGVVTRIF